MRIAISNIAWDIGEDVPIAEILNRHAIDAIDVAPGKYFADPEHATPQEIERVRRWWSDRGIEITGMQALLFGTSGLNLFGSATARALMLQRLAAICSIAEGLGASRLVFGSPRNRDRTGLADDEVDDIAVAFFRELGAAAAARNVKICLEPNPAQYHCNFMTSTPEAARIVRAVDHPAIRLHLDAGAMAINGESAATMVRDMASLVGHIHVSEPDLVPIGDGATDHRAVAAALHQYLPSHVASIEMVASKQEPHLAAVARAVQTTIQHYRNQALA